MRTLTKAKQNQHYLLYYLQYFGFDDNATNHPCATVKNNCDFIVN